MADIKTMKKHMSEIFEMKESFDVFLKDTESFDDGRRCYAIYKFIENLTMNAEYDVEVTEFNTSGHEIFIKTLINDGKYAVCVKTIPNPTKREIGDRIYAVIYGQPSGHFIANFSFNTEHTTATGMPFETTIGYSVDIDSEKHQVFSDVSLAIMKTIGWYLNVK